MSILIKNARIFKRDSLLPEKDILIEGNLISEIADNITDRGIGTSIDAKGKIVIPGLIDCHTHLWQTFGRGLMDDLHITKWLEIIWQFHNLFSEEALYYSTLIGAIEALRSGTTTVAELITPISEFPVAKAIDDSGLRLVFGKMANDYQEGENTPVNSTEKSLIENEDFYNKWQGKGDGRISVKFSFMGLPAATEELVMGIVRLSEKYCAGIHAHASEGKEPTEQVRRRFGKGEIETLSKLGVLKSGTQLAHTIWVNDSEIDLLVNSGTTVIHCPSTNCKITDGISPMYKMQKSGVNITFGCDGAASSSNYDLFLEARLGSMLQKAYSMDEKAFNADTVFEMLTTNSAKALGKEKKLGKIEEGYVADIVILDTYGTKFFSDDIILSNLIYSSSGPEIVRDVIVDGKLILKDSRMVTIDEGKILENARKVFKNEKDRLIAIREKW